MDIFCIKTEKYIKKNNLIQKGDRIVIALSGGADSVSLLCVLHKLKNIFGIELAAAHLHHGIRGETADRDALFCKELCERLGVPFYIKHVDIPEIARKEKISHELAGRRERYKFFDELKEYGYNKIATAHNSNDNAETTLMHLIRGSGIGGLGGISPRRGSIIRPILCMTRSEIEQYCAREGISYIHDETNFEKIYTRNKIRLDLIPMIEKEFNANFIERIGVNSGIIRDENEYMELEAKKAVSALKKDGGLEIGNLCSMHKAMQRRVIGMFIREKKGTDENISSSYIEDILGILESSGKRVDINDGFYAETEFGILHIKKHKDRENTGFDIHLEKDKEIYIEEAGITVKLVDGGSEEEGEYFGGDAGNVRIRSKKSGDIFYPAGMSGRKKVKNYFIEKKIPKDKRDSIPIIEIDGCVAWIVGYRRDRRFFGKNMKIMVKKVLQ